MSDAPYFNLPDDITKKHITKEKEERYVITITHITQNHQITPEWAIVGDDDRKAKIYGYVEKLRSFDEEKNIYRQEIPKLTPKRLRAIIAAISDPV